MLSYIEMRDKCQIDHLCVIKIARLNGIESFTRVVGLSSKRFRVW